MSSKFNKELQMLVNENVISSEIAKTIEDYYVAQNIGKPNKLFTIFGVFGALLIGSGIILMLAHNWDHFSRLTKTILAFVPLILGQALSGFSILKNKSKTWREASGTFLFFAVGASISLVSQIYNIPGELGVFLKTWIILGLPLIYVLRSHAVAILILVFSTGYALEEGIWNYRNTNTPWMYIIFLLAVIPQYWSILRTTVFSNMVTVYNWLIPISLSFALATFISGNEDYMFLMYVTLYGLLYTIGRLVIFKELRTLRNGFLIAGSLGTVIILMVFTFRWMWKEISGDLVIHSQEFYIALLLLIITLVSLRSTLYKKGFRTMNLFQISFAVFWILYFLPIGVVPKTVFTNILVFALGISAIKIGADKFNFGILNYGMLIISILIISRFFDTQINFIVKGILFVLVGAGFFLTNYIMLKRQQQLKQ